jgi:serine/threonine-protein kinase
MASVYEVFDRTTQRRLALKRLHSATDILRQRRMLELLQREFYTLSQISHPCVVEAYDYGTDEQGAYYTMELLQGEAVNALAPLSVPQLCRVAWEMCSVLSLLHSRRLVYRDLNPRNVHCTLDGTSKLLDFGAVATMGPCQQMVGTPAYCAPEAISSRSKPLCWLGAGPRVCAR